MSPEQIQRLPSDGCISILEICSEASSTILEASGIKAGHR